MRKSRWAGGLIVIALAAAGLHADEALPGIRFYIINSKGQQDKVSLAFATDKPGCHNLVPARTILRVAQVDFAYCTVHGEADCRTTSTVPARWKGAAAPVEKLTPGGRWMLPGASGSKIASWYCAPRE